MNGSSLQPVKSGHQWAGGKTSAALELWKGLGQTHKVGTFHCGPCCLFLAESKPLGTSKRQERRSNGKKLGEETSPCVWHLLHTSMFLFDFHRELSTLSYFFIPNIR